MRILKKGDNEIHQTEELEINGASIVFYSVQVLDQPLSITELLEIDELDGIQKVLSNQGYIEKIFNLNDNTKFDHLSYEFDSETILAPISLDNGDLITPTLKHYIHIYSKKILMVQSILLFDRNKITKYNAITKITSPIKTNDILIVIHNFKDKEKDCYKKLNRSVNKLTEKLISQIKRQKIKKEESVYLTNKHEQCISVQIWDIASLKLKEGEDIVGVELSTRYELELSAILSCYNEHFSSNELWKNQSANQVHQSALSRTDVLNDHQVLLSERVCVEISQVNYPKLRQISANRLFTYGYDSTSIFLWGYLIMVSAGYEVCDNKTNILHKKMIEMISESIKNYEGMKNIIVEKQLISKEIEHYDGIVKISIEERHKEYIKKGLNIRGLLNVKNHMDSVFSEMKELSEVTLAADTTKINNEINSLLKEVQVMNQNQGEASSKIALLSLILAFSAIFPLISFVVSVFPSLNNPIGLVIVLVLCVVILLVITKILLKRS